MTDTWQDVPAAAPAQSNDGWQDVPAAPAPEPTMGTQGISDRLSRGFQATNNPFAIYAGGKLKDIAADTADFFKQGLEQTEASGIGPYARSIVTGGASAPLPDIPHPPSQYDDLKPDVEKALISIGRTPEVAKQEAERIGRSWKRQEAMGNLVMGPMTALTAPILGAYRSLISRPLEEIGGPPKEVTEMAGMVAGAVAGMPAMSREMARVRVSPDGKVTAQRIGDLPKGEDFRTAAGLISEQKGEAPQETIAGAAIRVDGKTYVATSHVGAAQEAAFALRISVDDVIGKVGNNDNDLHGFATSTGRYVSREEASQIARQSDQIRYGEGTASEELRLPKRTDFDQLNIKPLPDEYSAREIQSGIWHVEGPMGFAANGKTRAEAVYNFWSGSSIDPLVDRPFVDQAVTEQNLRTLWDERGIHPAEALYEAKGDAFLKHELTQPPIEAFHGSRHDFEVFSNEKIGTGQGAQVYGHGLYFAENREVAHTYLGEGAEATVAGMPYNPENPTHFASSLIFQRGSKEAALAEARKQLARDPEEFKERVVSILERDTLPPVMEVPAHMYRVRIHAELEHMFDYDKALDEQSPHVLQSLERLRDMIKAENPMAQSGLMLDDILGDKNKALQKVIDATKEMGAATIEKQPLAFDDFYRQFAKYDFDEISAAEMMRQAGIPGIKYLDQQSRLSGKGTNNFVIFDDSAVQIVEKNGQPFYDQRFKQAIDARDARIIQGLEEPPSFEQPAAAPHPDRPLGEALRAADELRAANRDLPTQDRAILGELISAVRGAAAKRQLSIEDGVVQQGDRFSGAAAGKAPLSETAPAADAIAEHAWVEADQDLARAQAAMARIDEVKARHPELVPTIDRAVQAVEDTLAQRDAMRPGADRPLRSLSAGTPLNEKNSFAFRVLTAADEAKTPIGKNADQFHPDKVAISDLYQEYARLYGARNKDPLQQGEFKQKLLEAAQRGEVELARLDMPEMLDRPRALNSAIKWGDSEVHFLVKKKPSSLGAAASDEPPMTPLTEQPPAPAGSLVTDARYAVDQLTGLARNLQYMLDPMATGSPRAMVIAKDANSRVQRIWWERARRDADLVREFTPAQWERMWNAMDEESVLQQQGMKSEHMGLATLEPKERLYAEILHTDAMMEWLHTVDTGGVIGEGLPAYTVRMVLNVAEAQGQVSPKALNELGRNVFTRTAQMKNRKYLLAEETEAAAKEKVGIEMAKRGASVAEIEAAQEKIKIARNVRAMPLATAKLAEANVWREMINNIRDVGKATGEDTVADFNPGKGWFTIEGHPAFTTWEVLRDNATGAVRLDENGNAITVPRSLYMPDEFKGPLKAILDEGVSKNKIAQGAVTGYGALMAIKGKSMQLILNSPAIHNVVVLSKVMEAVGGRELLGTALYWRGNKIVDGNPGRFGQLVERGLQAIGIESERNPSRASELIERGLFPIGKRGSIQDITGMMETPDVLTGHNMSWSAKVAGAIPGLFDPAAGVAVERSIAATGNFIHNTLLWDRVRDLQFGLADHLSDHIMAKYGTDRIIADRIATHFSNIVVGSLPKESMSAGARAAANMLLFSRSFTLGNLSVFKQAAFGLPKPIMAQIARDFEVMFEKNVKTGEYELPADGMEAAKQVQIDASQEFAKGFARRKALSTILLSAGLFYVGNALLQHAFNIMARDETLDDQLKGYARRYKSFAEDVSKDPTELHRLISRLSPTYENEPHKQDRILTGFDKDGTAIYARSPTGKYGEEVIGYPNDPMKVLRSKLNPMVGGFVDIMENDKGFGHKVYDETDKSAGGKVSAFIASAKHMVMKHLPEQQIVAADDLLRGDGDTKVNLMRLLGPVVGFSASVGAPGGPARGEVFGLKEEMNARFNLAWPDLKKQIQRGDVQEAMDRMTKMQIPPRIQMGLIRTARDPSNALRGNTVKQFMQSATPEQIDRFQRALQMRSQQ